MSWSSIPRAICMGAPALIEGKQAARTLRVERGAASLAPEVQMLTYDVDGVSVELK